MYLTDRDFKRVDKALDQLEKKLNKALKIKDFKALAYLEKELERIKDELEETMEFAQQIHGVYKKRKNGKQRI